MKKITFLIFFLFSYVFASAQVLTSLSENSFFQGEVIPHNMTIYGNNIFSVPITQKIYGIYLQNTLAPASSIALLDSNNFPNAGSSLYKDSIEFYPSTIIPFSLDTGNYNLILVRCINGHPPTVFYFDTLLNAAHISSPDAIISGKMFIDNNLNKLFDTGDDIDTTLRISLDYDDSNIRYDSIGNFYFPAMNGPHHLGGLEQAQYIVNTDSTSYQFLVNDTNITNLDFGFVPALYSCTPDTVYQNDTVTFNIYSHGLFVFFDLEYMGFADTSNSLLRSFYPFNDPNIIVYDSTHIEARLIVNLLPGDYYLKAVLFVNYFTYTLPYMINVQPPTTTNIDYLNNNGTNVYPNPFNDYLNIDSRFVSRLKSFSILNNLGQIILQEKLYSNYEKLNLQDLSAGLYFIKLKFENEETQFFKIIKE